MLQERHPSGGMGGARAPRFPRRAAGKSAQAPETTAVGSLLAGGSLWSWPFVVASLAGVLVGIVAVVGPIAAGRPTRPGRGPGGVTSSARPPQGPGRVFHVLELPRHHHPASSARPPALREGATTARRREPQPRPEPAPPRPAPAPSLPRVVATPGPSAIGSLTSRRVTPAVGSRVLVADESGRRVVARVHALDDAQVVVMLPDGRLGHVDCVVPTDAAFRPLAMDEARRGLAEDASLRDYRTVQTEHYLVLSDGSDRFARATANLLESLHRGLDRFLQERALRTHRPEFPLIAVIDRTEERFRGRREIPAESVAYYDPWSNRIHLMETPDEDRDVAGLDGLRRSQTVAHEGAHQVFQNIGMQQRLAPWPAWLAEGLAEYCAPTQTQSDGSWGGVSRVNPLHMVTLSELDDPMSGRSTAPAFAARSGLARTGRPSIEAIVGREELAPTDYAVAWALTHYLLSRQKPAFAEYLKEIGRLKPLEARTPAEHRAAFRHAFAPVYKRLDLLVRNHTKSLEGSYDEPLSYLAVFEQVGEDGGVSRDVLVSQSPAVIRQWLDDCTALDVGPTRWHVKPYFRRSHAILMARRLLGPR